jgi:phosphatidylglycerophosphatase GEP4
MLNISGTFNVLRLLVNPALCLPHHTVATFDQLPVPLSSAFHRAGTKASDGKAHPDIRAVVLDKDNCFAVPHQNEIHAAYAERFAQLRKEFPGSRLLIVSNSSGTNSDKGHVEAALLERNTGVKVLRHGVKKPGCHAEIMEYLRNAPDTGVTSTSQVAIIGDRLFTDILMANMMGAHGIWIKDGPVPDNGVVCANTQENDQSTRAKSDQFTRIEKGLSSFLLRRGYLPPSPRSDFE